MIHSYVNFEKNLSNEEIAFNKPIQVRKNYMYQPKPQTKLSLTTVNSLMRNAISLIHVLGQPQIGKTDFIRTIIYDFLTNPTSSFSKFDKIYILTSVNECNLHEQTKREIYQPFINDMSSAYRHKVFFYKESEFREKISSGGLLLTNCLILIDESDYGSSQGVIRKGKHINKQNMYRLFESCGLALNGSKAAMSKLQSKNVAVILISASNIVNINECIDRYKNGTMHKQNLMIYPEIEDYKSFDKMMKNGQIRESFSIVDTNGKITNDFRVLISEFKKSSKHYSIIRCERHMTDEKMRDIAIHLGCKCIIIDQKTKHDIIREYNCIGSVFDIFEDNPATHTLVFVKNFLRRGNVIPTEGKRNIFAVFDNYRAKGATTCQGLAGRMCGYGQHNALIYCNKSQLEDYIEVFNILKRYAETGDVSILEEITNLPTCQQLNAPNVENRYVHEPVNTFKIGAGAISFTESGGLESGARFEAIMEHIKWNNGNKIPQSLVKKINNLNKKKSLERAVRAAYGEELQELELCAKNSMPAKTSFFNDAGAKGTFVVNGNDPSMVFFLTRDKCNKFVKPTHSSYKSQFQA